MIGQVEGGRLALDEHVDLVEPERALAREPEHARELRVDLRHEQAVGVPPSPAELVAHGVSERRPAVHRERLMPAQLAYESLERCVERSQRRALLDLMCRRRCRERRAALGATPGARPGCCGAEVEAVDEAAQVIDRVG